MIFLTFGVWSHDLVFLKTHTNTPTHTHHTHTIHTHTHRHTHARTHTQSSPSPTPHVYKLYFFVYAYVFVSTKSDKDKAHTHTHSHRQTGSSHLLTPHVYLDFFFFFVNAYVIVSTLSTAPASGPIVPPGAFFHKDCYRTNSSDGCNLYIFFQVGAKIILHVQWNLWNKDTNGTSQKCFLFRSAAFQGAICTENSSLGPKGVSLFYRMPSFCRAAEMHLRKMRVSCKTSTPHLVLNFFPRNNSHPEIRTPLKQGHSWLNVTKAAYFIAFT
jgi:hypothetical protein